MKPHRLRIAIATAIVPSNGRLSHGDHFVQESLCIAA